MSSEGFFPKPAFDLLLSELVSPQLNSLSYSICVTVCQASRILYLPLALLTLHTLHSTALANIYDVSRSHRNL